MLCSLLDGHARTATELAALAEVGASTASAHLARLREDGLLSMLAQGKHRYYRLASAEVGQAPKRCWWWPACLGNPSRPPRRTVRATRAPVTTTWPARWR
jgi:DNA-binding transcriptional ArsR family regulator